jgi:hypothetical protein
MSLKNTLFTFCLFLNFLGFGQGKKEVSLAELNRELENPLSKYWSLIMQENLSLNNGDAIAGTQITNVFYVQPSLPVTVFKSRVLLIRPVFPLVTLPTFNDNGEKTGRETGFSDFQIFTLYGRDKKEGFIWGGGLTFTFPTASSQYLGSGKYQIGPAFTAFSITEKWTLGFIFQHWNTVGGSEDRDDVTKTDLQYVIRKQIKGKAMSIGMGPNITINWEAEDGNKLSLPIGLGLTKTVKWGKTAWKMTIEPQYYIVKPDDYGTQWNFRVQLAPVFRNPF